MKIIHTADLHLGQFIYQHYERVDEHEHFFDQLGRWCRDEHPDALVVSGDIFDIQQPSASTRQFFNEHFVAIARKNPDMAIVITAGNHDSALRVEADRPVWELANVYMVGVAPGTSFTSEERDWCERYIVRLRSGYIVALPFMMGDRHALVQELLDKVAVENTEGKPVVLTGHLAVTGSDITGHGEIGKIRTQGIETFGRGYDYLALGHLHKPQTLGHLDDALRMEAVTYPAGVARYSGSALHVSCDEMYPHSVSVVEMPGHFADVTIRQLCIDELRHFFILPEDGTAYATAEGALTGVKEFCESGRGGYFRLRIDSNAVLPSSFNQSIYDILSDRNDEVRYNPKIVWNGMPEHLNEEAVKPVFEVAELQQMTDPVVFIEKTANQYPGLDLEMVREAFEEVMAEMRSMEDTEKQKEGKKAAKKAAMEKEEEV